MATPCRYFINGKTLSKEQFLDYVKSLPQDEIAKVTPLMKKKVGEFRSSHFDEKNILVHIRHNTRTDAEGNKVLFLEEVQSDWGQKGKKEGFDDKDLEKKRGSLLDEMYVLERQQNDNITTKKVANTGTISDFEVSYKNEKLNEDLEKKINNIRSEVDKINKQTGITPTAPFVTDTNAWVKLGLKVALKEAVAQGATKIAWTTGEQQNDRYDLSKQVEYIQYEDGFGGTKYVDISTQNSIITLQVDKDGKVLENKNTQLPDVVGKNLSDVIGKDATEKIMKGDGTKERIDPLVVKDEITGKYDVIINGRSVSSGHETYNEARADYMRNPKYASTRRLQGEGLKVGGKGMKGFYGSPTEGSLGIVGNAAKSLFKQDVGTVEFKTKGKQEYTVGKTTEDVKIFSKRGDSFTYNGDPITKQRAFEIVERGGQFEAWSKSDTTQNSITVTPEMRTQVQNGLALFQKQQGQNAKGAMVAADGNFIIYALTDPNVSTPLHEVAHVFEHYLTDSERATVNNWAKTGAWTTQTSEKFARGFEKYLAEGVAPTEGLKKIFEKFKKWLTDIYNGITGSDIDIELNDDMRSIYAKMLGEDAIKQTAKPEAQKEGVTEKPVDNGKNQDGQTEAEGQDGLLN